MNFKVLYASSMKLFDSHLHRSIIPVFRRAVICDIGHHIHVLLCEMRSIKSLLRSTRGRTQNNIPVIWKFCGG